MMSSLASQGTQTDEPSQPEVIVTFIHGTFAQQAAWVRPGSALREELERAFGKHVAFPPFSWSGDNTVYARKEAGDELADHLNTIHAAHPEVRQVLIAHSHGGNIAVYALRDLRADVNVAGIACIATPFLHANLRDERIFDRKTLQGALAGLWSLGLLLILLFGPFEPGFWTLLITTITLLVGAVISAILGGYLSGALEGLQELSSHLAAQLDCRLNPSTNLFIVRKVGDEASLALSTGQFLSWATTKAFAYFSAEDQRPWRRNLFTGRRLPRTVWALWGISLLIVIASTGWAAISQQNPTTAEFGVLAKFSLTLAMLATMLVKTIILQRFLFGAAFLGLAGAASLGTFAFGTIPGVYSETGHSHLDSFRGWLVGTLLALSIEINTEATPRGLWIVRQLESTDDDRRADNKALVHSAYDDPRVIDDLIFWFATSTGLRDARIGQQQAT